MPPGATRSVRSLTAFAFVLGAAKLVNCPEFVPGIDTMIRPSFCTIVDSGMNRSESPARVPAVRPDASTTMALLAASKLKLRRTISTSCGAVGA